MAPEYLTSSRAIRETLHNPPAGSRLLVSGSGPRIQELSGLAVRAGVTVVKTTAGELSRVASGKHDCALEIHGEHARQTTISSVIENAQDESLVLLLDHVVDPQNLGAILRSADQFAVDAVIVPERRASPMTASVIQASAGTAAHVALITVTNLARSIEELQKGGYWVYAAEMKGEPVHRAKLDGRVVLVMGGEGSGVSRLILERSDGLISIPIRGHSDSLNVSVACGVMLYEVRRQQGWLDTVSGAK